MKSAVRFIAGQSGWLVLFLVLFALTQGWYVCEGLWQGSGLRGYTQHRDKSGSAYMVSTWTAFVRMLACAGLAGVLVIFGQRHGEVTRVAAQGFSRMKRRKPPLSAGRKR